MIIIYTFSWVQTWAPDWNFVALVFHTMTLDWFPFQSGSQTHSLWDHALVKTKSFKTCVLLSFLTSTWHTKVTCYIFCYLTVTTIHPISSTHSHTSTRSTPFPHPVPNHRNTTIQSIPRKQHHTVSIYRFSLKVCSGSFGGRIIYLFEWECHPFLDANSCYFWMWILSCFQSEFLSFLKVSSCSFVCEISSVSLHCI